VKVGPNPNDPTPVTTTLSGTAVNLLWGGNNNIVGEDFDLYSAPRVGFDYAVIPSLTLGGSIGYLHRSGKTEVSENGVSASTDTPTGNGFVINPRIGYALSLTPTIAIWPRGGVTYFTANEKTTSMAGTTRTTSISGFAVSLDPQLVISPVPHFAFMVGPVADIPLAGHVTNERVNTMTGISTSTETSTKVTNFGITAGVLGYF